jgi:formylglycine-generating enzyme required for sulfatase activity
MSLIAVLLALFCATSLSAQFGLPGLRPGESIEDYIERVKAMSDEEFFQILGGMGEEGAPRESGNEYEMMSGSTSGEAWGGEPFLGEEEDGFVFIHGGSFTMGSPESEVGRNYDETQHDVWVSDFFMSPFEVTQKEFAALMAENPSYPKGDTLPANYVTWYAAIEYCNKLSDKAGLDRAYTIYKNQRDPSYWGVTFLDDDVEHYLVTFNAYTSGYRLPTEAEWEYACRAGTTTPFATGNRITPKQANYSQMNSIRDPLPVGSFPPNAWGLYDMHGNVSEWCWDWYGSYGNSQQQLKSDPLGVSEGEGRVTRGGSFINDPPALRSAHRASNLPWVTESGDAGFRLVRSYFPPPPPMPEPTIPR